MRCKHKIVLALPFFLSYICLVFDFVSSFTPKYLPRYLENMPPKRQQAWNDLENKMKNKRKKANTVQQRGKKAGSATHELMVQRLASEPDHKQTFKPVQPREFVAYGYEDLTLPNLRKACAAHFRLPASSCDVLVTNKGPSCTHINQIPHRKDKVLN